MADLKKFVSIVDDLFSRAIGTADVHAAVQPAAARVTCLHCQVQPHFDLVGSDVGVVSELH